MPSVSVATWLPITVLASILIAAVWHDVRSRRIPNPLVLLGTIAAFALHSLIPSGAGLFTAPAGSLGPLSSLGGFAVGLLLLLPFYALKTLGAGDVKLMAMIGAFLGPASIGGAVLATMISGGVLALCAAILTGRLRLLMGNLYLMAVTRSHRPEVSNADGVRGSAGTLPYAIAIATGTAIQLFRISN